MNVNQFYEFIHELEHGDYHQIYGNLAGSGDKCFCASGLLAYLLMDRSHVTTIPDGNRRSTFDLRLHKVLPHSTRRYLSIPASLECWLIDMNDKAELSFTQIAQVLRSAFSNGVLTLEES